MTGSCPWCDTILVQTAAVSDARGVSAVCENGHVWDVVAWAFMDDGTPLFELGMLVWPMPLVAMADAEDHEPLFMELVVGYRAWTPRRDVLHSIGYTQQSWNPGDNQAVCAVGGNHSAPNPECTCGLYAYHHPQSVGHGIRGAIVAWGDLDVHQRGFRAAHARIVALTDPGEGGGLMARASGELKAIAKRYDVPIVPAAALQSVALEHGQPLPEAVLPDPRTTIEAGTMFGDCSIVAVRWVAGEVWRCRCMNCMMMFAANVKDLLAGKVKCTCHRR